MPASEADPGRSPSGRYPAANRNPRCPLPTAAGAADYRSLVEAKMREADDRLPGRLTLEVEAGKARVQPAERFRGLLEHAARIAQMNAAVNRA